MEIPCYIDLIVSQLIWRNMHWFLSPIVSHYYSTCYIVTFCCINSPVFLQV